MNCPQCKQTNLKLLYEVERVPVFQNIPYDTRQQALDAPCGSIALTACRTCGFVFNAAFKPELMRYCEQYHNEQHLSGVFQDHQREVLGLLLSLGAANGPVVEIGCGKGIFLEQMAAHGLDVHGFDPAYEGRNPRIVKDFFSGKYSSLNAQTIVLRHTLEHIPAPLEFLQTIARANEGRGRIFLEVPCYDWIRTNAAFWDICYEHCNYFTMPTLRAMFSGGEGGALFGGQYLWFTAELEALLPSPSCGADAHDGPQEAPFKRELGRIRAACAASDGLAAWGAGAKGTIFVNTVDPDRHHVAGLVDINPHKQGRYVGGSGHRIVAPEDISTLSPSLVVVMNDNYLDEIKEYLAPTGLTPISLADL